ncbi:T6SS immunity protein Tli4 family protein [Burkholderia anthina]|uniref:T6SS immunity protein Tli4 family protein n=1 Tax=Burkholderia anthina TaxID=179879 RepID=UPI0018C5A40C
MPEAIRIAYGVQIMMTLDMNTGAPNNVLQEKIDKASLTDGESVALWDSVSRSLRPRQDSF